MQTESRQQEESLGTLLANRLAEQVIFHNAELLTGTRIVERLLGNARDDVQERDTLVAFLTANLNGATSVDEITDFAVLKMPPHSEEVQQMLQEEAARESARREKSNTWTMPAKRVWESIFLFDRRFELLDYRDEPTVELLAREWFDSLHLLPNEGIVLSTGERVTVRLSWSSYFGSIETDDIVRLKREAEDLASSKVWEGREWARKQELPLPDLDDEGCELPEITERVYGVSPTTGKPLCCYGTVGPASYKSDSGDPQSWRPQGEESTFITHWFKERGDAQNCRDRSEALIGSLKANRLRGLHKKQSAEAHKVVARKLQAKLQLLADASLVVDARKATVHSMLADVEPILAKTKSSTVIRWSSEAEELLGRLLREAMATDDAACAFIDGLFGYVIEHSSEGVHQDVAVGHLDQLESAQKNGTLRSMDNRSAKLDELLVAVIESVTSPVADEMLTTVAA